jgi:L-ascorbate metabolism protein UlaG (beta-lactamase superfamily)
MTESTFRQPVDAQGRFVNLDGSTPHRFWSVLRWGVADRVLGRRRRTPDRAPMARIEPDLALLRQPVAPGDGARLTWLGHASWLVQLDGLSLLVDPVLGDRIAGVPRRNAEPGVSVEGLPHIDAQLVTHGHYDHLDLPTLERVGAPVVIGLGHRAMLERRGLTGIELGWWSSLRFGRVAVTFVPARHWSRRGLVDQNRALWGGFVIQGSTAAVYHAGDTGYFAGFGEIGRRFPSLDAALVPIGAYDPPWFMGRHHLDPEQALRAFGELGARTFLAMHWGTFKLTDEPLDEPPRRLEAERARLGLPAQRVCVPAIGETICVGGSPPRRTDRGR